MPYKVYWNNICLLSNMEENFIKNTVNSNDFFPYNFEYYGLGRTSSMKEKILSDIKEGEICGDIIISTDLDIFQDNRITKDFFHSFQQKSLLLPIDESLQRSSISHVRNYFHPFIVIPLVMVVNTQYLGDNKTPESFLDLLAPSFNKQYAFGGLHNSAGRSLFKALWYLYGEEIAESFIANAIVTTMPAQAFQKVKTGEVMVSIVPTIFAKRSGIHALLAYWPQEGAIAIPSYVAIKKNVAAKDFQLLKNTILGIEHQQQLRDLGDIIPTHPDVPPSSFITENKNHLLYPTWDFFETLDHEKFDALCEKYTPY